MAKDNMEQVAWEATWKITLAVLIFSLHSFISSVPADARSLPIGPIDMDSAKEILADKELLPVEGIWELKQKDYIGHFLIIKNTTTVKTDWDFLAVIIDSSNELDNPGEIKFLLKNTEASNVFDCNYYQKGTFNTIEFKGTMTLIGEEALQFPVLKLSNKINTYIKVFPKKDKP